MRNEAHHNLLLGLLGTLEADPDFYGPSVYFAAALDRGEAVAVAVMTPPRQAGVSLCEDEAAMATLARDVFEYRRETPGVIGPAREARWFAEAWSAVSGDRYAVNLAERCYKLVRVEPPAGVSGGMRRATEADIDLLTDWRMAFMDEAVPFERTSREETRREVLAGLRFSPEERGTFFWEDGGEPVAMVAYGSPTPNSLRIGPVYTPPRSRRRGYASACTAATCAYILASGKTFCTLFADLANPTSNRIYQAIGFEPVCDVDMYAFTPSAAQQGR
jgi:predicted GNAT family acetyltransferase